MVWSRSLPMGARRPLFGNPRFLVVRVALGNSGAVQSSSSGLIGHGPQSHSTLEQLSNEDSAPELGSDHRLALLEPLEPGREVRMSGAPFD